jgi:hypothetical protein
MEEGFIRPELNFKSCFPVCTLELGSLLVFPRRMNLEDESFKLPFAPVVFQDYIGMTNLWGDIFAVHRFDCVPELLSH